MLRQIRKLLKQAEIAVNLNLIRFWWGTATRGNGERLVQVQRCPATVNGYFELQIADLEFRISQDARREIDNFNVRGTHDKISS